MIIDNPKRAESLVEELVVVWERSVRATHIFLSEADICNLRPLVVEGIREIEYLILSSDHSVATGFIGVSQGKVEMLFIDPPYFGKGFGKALIVEAINKYGVTEVDVNEQNPKAVDFYEYLGFETFERTPTDGQGANFPILKMRMNPNGLLAWEKNAQFWDDTMGDESNFFHCDLVRPSVEKLLELKESDLVLDIACGNGNFSARMAQMCIEVVAFDYSPKMIELAKSRRSQYLDKIEFRVCDATKYDQLIALKRQKPFDKAVANMAIMDIIDIVPLFRAVRDMLSSGGLFVFTTHHPCFTYPNEDYFTCSTHKGVAIEGQPILQNYYHRSMSDILKIAFQSRFVLDGMNEVPFDGDKTPIIMVLRLRKV